MQQGVSFDVIKNALRSNGWVDADINQAFDSLVTPQGVIPPVTTVQSFEPSVPVTSHKKFQVAAVIIVVVLLVVGGTILAYTTSLQPAPDYVPTAITTNNPGTPVLPAVSSTTENVTTQAPVATTSVTATAQDCGSVVSTKLMTQSGTSTLTAQEKTSLACMSKAIIDCSPAILTSTASMSGVNYNSSIKINGLNGSDCSITSKVNSPSPASTKTCKIPVSLISEVVQEAQKRNQTDFLVIAVGFFFMEGPITNTQTGQKITLDCI